MNLKFRAFRAVNEYETSRLYLNGHVKVLHDYGIQNITSSNASWMSNPNVYCVIAELDGEIIGGIRVQIADGINPLPVELAVGDMDKRIYEKVKAFAKEGAGELCGLWNAKKVAGMGVSMLLVRAGISIINQLNFKTLMGICGDYTLEMFNKVGFVIDKSLGNNGEFVYPKSDLIARVLGILNAETLESAHSYDKERMLDLRNNPVQYTEEQGSKGILKVDYNLVVKLK